MNQYVTYGYSSISIMQDVCYKSSSVELSASGLNYKVLDLTTGGRSRIPPMHVLFPDYHVSLTGETMIK